MDEENTTLEEPLNKNFREPKIRFPEFHDSWQQIRLGSICDVLVGGEAPERYIRSKEPSESFIYPIYSNGIGENALWGYSDSYRVDKKSITYSSIGSLGHPEIRNPFYTPIIRLKVLIPKQDINLVYLKYALSRNAIGKNGGSLASVNSDFMKKLKINYTYNVLEQTKLGNLFGKIDDMMNYLESKISALKKYKEGLVNDWFSNDSNKVQLKSLVNQKPSPLLKSHFKENSGQYPVYDASGQPYTTINFYNNDQDSVAIIKYGSGCGNTFITRNKHSVLGTMSELIPKDKELLEYIYAYTLSKQFRKICTRYTEIGTTPNLYFSDYSEEYIYIPKDKVKTKKFIEVFKRIEEEESICQNKLSVLSHIKAHLLKNMFI